MQVRRRGGSAPKAVPRSDSGVRKRGATGARLRPAPDSSERSRARRTQRERADTSSTGLLGAALELIAERGYRGTSLIAIGERAGYSRGLVSERFGSKEGLLKELASRMMTSWQTRVTRDEVGAHRGVPALLTIVRAHRQAIKEKPASMRALYVLLFESMLELPELREGFRAIDSEWRQTVEAYLVQGQKEGLVRADIDPSAQAALSLAVIRGITLQWMMDPTALDLDRVYGELERWVDRGLGVPAVGSVGKKRSARS